MTLSWTCTGFLATRTKRLTGCKYGPLDQTRRIHGEVSQLSFLVLPEMVREADDLYERVMKIRAETRAVGRNTPTMGQEKARPLREREPWI